MNLNKFHLKLNPVKVFLVKSHQDYLKISRINAETEDISDKQQQNRKKRKKVSIRRHKNNSTRKNYVSENIWIVKNFAGNT